MKILVAIIAFFGLVTSLAQGQSLPTPPTITQTPVDINNRLQESLEKLSEESRKEQKLTGGVMALAGGALATAAFFGTIIGNDFSTQEAPALYISASGLLTIGGIMNLSRSNSLTERVKVLKLRPQTTLEDIQENISAGQLILSEEASRSRLERNWGGWLTIAAGAANIAIGEVFPAPPSRLDFEVAGYTSASLGLADYMIEGRRFTGTALVGMGLSNAITDRIDPNSPSSDYLLISGAITVAAGIARLVIPYPAEREQSLFFDSIKNETKTEFFVIPSPEGMIATTKVNF